MNGNGKMTFNELPSELLAAMQGLEDYVQSCELSIEELELVRLLSSKIHGCKFCTNMHLQIAKENNISSEKIDSIQDYQNSDLLSELEKNILTLTENLSSTMTIDFTLQQKIIDQKGKSYLASLLLVISQINAWNRIVKSCGL